MNRAVPGRFYDGARGKWFNCAIKLSSKTSF